MGGRAGGRRLAVVGESLGCAMRVGGLTVRRELHRRKENVGERARLPDGRELVVFRETTRGTGGLDGTVTLAVWFHLRWMPPGSRVRRYLFERESILNTALYAGFDGYRLKLWMVDRASCDFAGLYAWCGVDAAERYARYITAVLRPLSTPDSVGATVVGQRLDHYLAATGSRVVVADGR